MTPDKRAFEAKVDELLHAYGHSIGRYGNNRHERLIEAKAAVLAAYDAGREGPDSCMNCHGPTTRHMACDDCFKRLCEFAYTHPAPKADAAADSAETLTAADWVETLTYAADMLDSYAALQRDKVPADEIERWHYVPEVEDFAGRLRTLAASLAPKAAAADWVCVPREPTPAMIQAWRQAAVGRSWSEQGYAAMLAASPARAGEGESEPGMKLALDISDLLTSERLRHEVELAETQQDASRYRWLRHGDNDEDVIQIYDPNNGTSRPFDYRLDACWMLRDEKLDAAIDAAMSREAQ